MKKKLAILKNKKFQKIMGLIFILAVFGSFYLYFRETYGKIFIDNSLIQAPILNISPSTSGKVQEINVKEGQMVQTGDTLAVIGSETLRADTEGLIISASDLTGSMINPQTQLIQMIRPVNLRVVGTIDENKGLNQIRVGQVVSFSIDALPGREFWGFIDEISPSAMVDSWCWFR